MNKAVMFIIIGIILYSSVANAQNVFHFSEKLMKKERLMKKAS